MKLRDKYKNIFKHLDEDFDEYRYLVVVDENYDDIDSDEFDAIDPEDYNFIIYITERVQNILGEDGMKQLISELENHEKFDDFILSDIDNYGIKSDLDEEGVAREILKVVDGIVG